MAIHVPESIFSSTVSTPDPVPSLAPSKIPDSSTSVEDCHVEPLPTVMEDMVGPVRSMPMNNVEMLLNPESS